MSTMNFGAVNVLIHGQNRNLIELQRAALSGFKFRKIDACQEFGKLLQALQTKPRDIVIVNQSMEMDLPVVFRALRDHEHNPNPFSVVLLFTGTPSRRFLRDALRMGADGVVGLPFSAADLWKQLAYFVNAQRAFVRTSDYFGPDRRRMRGIVYNGDERRAGETFDEDHVVRNDVRVSAAR